MRHFVRLRRSAAVTARSSGRRPAQEPAVLAAVSVPLGVVVAFVVALLVNLVTPSKHRLWLVTMIAVVLALLTILTIRVAWRQARLQGGQQRDGATGQYEGLFPEELADAREVLAAQVRKIWIEDWLDKSLADVTRRELDLTWRPDAVDPPVGWLPLVHRPTAAAQPLPAGTPLSTITARSGSHLLVLGNPGSGKTILLLEHARTLLDQLAPTTQVDHTAGHATQAGPADQAADVSTKRVPVVLQLSTWTATSSADAPPDDEDDGRVLASWLADQLLEVYRLSRRQATALVNHECLALLLDGLDEVEAGPRRDACVAAINAFQANHGTTPLVVCSRTRDYNERTGPRLALDTAIEIQPLSPERVRGWLGAAEEPLTGLEAALHDDPPLWALLDTPLMLNLAELAYHDRPPTAVRATSDPAARRKQLLDDYVKRMLERRRGPLDGGSDSPETPLYDPQEIVLWLRWLARQLNQRGQMALYPDLLQPDWLRTRDQQWLATTGLSLVVGLAGGLIGVLLGLVGVPVGGLAFPLAVGLAGVLVGSWAFGGLIVGLAAGQAAHGQRIELTEPIGWSWAAVFRTLPRRLPSQLVGRGFTGFLAFMSTGMLFTFLAAGLAGSLSGMLTVLLVVWLAVGLASGLRVQSTRDPVRPGSGVRTSLRTARQVGLVVGLVVGLLGLIVGLTGGWAGGLIVGLGGGLIAGLVAGLRAGGATYLRHRVLLALLRHDGQIPADLVGFLSDCDSRMLLRQAGGGYQFVHPLLQHYFAKLELGALPLPPGQTVAAGQVSPRLGSAGSHATERGGGR
jgi:eukaryotic-like serine/threonine-protein kinase